MIVFDIETLPCNDQETILELQKEIKAPGQFKKPESIAVWMKENKEAELEKIVSKTSFDGMYGRVACIAWAFDDGEILSTNDYMSEAEAITLFYDSIENSSIREYLFCGHNIAGFDLPFLKHRSIILGIRPPNKLLEAMNAKPWDICIADTMLMWSADKHKQGSMDRLCKAFGIYGKGDFDGSMVAETWLTDPQKVIDYCKDDVHRTREMYKKLTFSTQLKLSKSAA
ncbi:hypothetical protein [uncultured Paraglaciecola sp.]|uniref:hypothetical protein n=1 Tax=uncultured Paraglaciecola sp. TaxID=1765024 RepID=UPI0026122925|nr:hypothetical protein [uncultured Paraglaciecola sp.]